MYVCKAHLVQACVYMCIKIKTCKTACVRRYRYVRACVYICKCNRPNSVRELVIKGFILSFLGFGALASI